MLTALIIGDMHIDVNNVGRYDGISREVEGLPIFRIEKQTFNPGGAANLAMNVATLGVKTLVMGTWGNRFDIHRAKLQEIFSNARIDTTYMVQHGITPIFGKYILPMGHHIHRIDLMAKPIEDDVTDHLITNLKCAMFDVDFIIVADYDEAGKGIITPKLIYNLQSFSQEKIIFGTSRLRLNMLKEFDYVVMNQNELNNQYDDISSLLAHIDPSEYAVMTNGAKGASCFSNTGNMDAFPSISAEGKIDPCGCGDTFLAVFATCIAQGRDIESAINTANAGARYTAKQLFTTGYPTWDDIDEQYKIIQQTRHAHQLT